MANRLMEILKLNSSDQTSYRTGVLSSEYKVLTNKQVPRTKHKALVAGILLLALALACGGSGSAPSGSLPSSTDTPVSESLQICRTGATAQHSVQTFVDGQVITTDTTCDFGRMTEIVCNHTFVDSLYGPGTGTQTSRFASQDDIIDETSVNPPLSRSLGTTTVITVGNTDITTIATNNYDAQRRLVSTVIDNPPPIGGQTTFTYTVWDSSGRPTAGTQSLVNGPPGPITITYDDAAHTAKRDIPPNLCTDTYDQNGIMIKEECTGTMASTTIVTIQETGEICT